MGIFYNMEWKARESIYSISKVLFFFLNIFMGQYLNYGQEDTMNFKTVATSERSESGLTKYIMMFYFLKRFYSAVDIKIFPKL